MPKELPFSAVLVPVRSELVRRSVRYNSLNVFPLEDGSAQAAHSGAAVDASAHSAAVECVSARVAEFAERGAVPFAVFEVRWCFSWPLAGVLFLAVAAASGVPDFA